MFLSCVSVIIHFINDQRSYSPLTGFGHHSCWTNYKVLLGEFCGRGDKVNDSCRFLFKIQVVKSREYHSKFCTSPTEIAAPSQHSRQSREENNLSANTICHLGIMTHFDTMFFCSVHCSFFFDMVQY